MINFGTTLLWGVFFGRSVGIGSTEAKSYRVLFMTRKYELVKLIQYFEAVSMSFILFVKYLTFVWDKLVELIILKF